MTHASNTKSEQLVRNQPGSHTHAHRGSEQTPWPEHVGGQQATTFRILRSARDLMVPLLTLVVNTAAADVSGSRIRTRTLAAALPARISTITSDSRSPSTRATSSLIFEMTAPSKSEIVPAKSIRTVAVDGSAVDGVAVDGVAVAGIAVDGVAVVGVGVGSSVAPGKVGTGVVGPRVGAALGAAVLGAAVLGTVELQPRTYSPSPALQRDPLLPKGASQSTPPFQKEHYIVSSGKLSSRWSKQDGTPWCGCAGSLRARDHCAGRRGGWDRRAATRTAHSAQPWSSFE